MDVLDEQGRLLGIVNVVDALVVLFILAVLIAGAALVLGSGSEPDSDASTFVTLDLGPQQSVLADRIQEGDTYAPTEHDRITITDIYQAPQGGQIRTFVRARLNGTAIEERPDSVEIPMHYRGEFPRIGRVLEIQTPVYNASGPIRAVGGNENIDRATRKVIVTAEVTPDDARALSAGDSIESAGRTVGAIEEVQTYETNDPDRIRVTAGISLQTVAIGQRVQFGGVPVQRGATIPVRTDVYAFDGRIERTGTANLSLETRSVLVSEVLESEDAQAITPGDTYEVAGRTIATVEKVQLYNTGNPDRIQAFVGLSLETVGLEDRSRFGNTRLQEGATIPFRTDAYTLNGRIERLDATTEPGTATDRTVTLQLTDIPPTRAAMIETGMIDRAGGETIAKLVDVRKEPSQVVLTSVDGEIFLRDHPINKDLTISARLSVRKTVNGVRFKGETIQRGSEVTLAFDDTTIQATVVGL